MKCYVEINQEKKGKKHTHKKYKQVRASGFVNMWQCRESGKAQRACPFPNTLLSVALLSGCS